MHMVLVSGSAHEPDEHGDEGGDWERKWGGVEAPNTIEKLKCRLRAVAGEHQHPGASAARRPCSPQHSAKRGLDAAMAGRGAIVADGKENVHASHIATGLETAVRELAVARQEAATLLHLNMQLQLQASKHATEIAQHGEQRRAEHERLQAYEDQLCSYENSLRQIRNENAALRCELENAQLHSSTKHLKIASQELAELQRRMHCQEEEMHRVKDLQRRELAPCQDLSFDQISDKLTTAMSELKNRDAELFDRDQEAQATSLREAHLQGRLAAVLETLASREAELAASSTRAQQVVVLREFMLATC